MSTRKIAFAAVIAAVYAALTMINPLGYGPVQFRFSEILCILPLFFPFSVWGLFVGCIIANLLSAYGTPDVVFGSLATLIAAICTMYIGRLGKTSTVAKVLACLPPVIFNALIVGAVITYAMVHAPGTGLAFWPTYTINAIEVGVSEAVTLFALGLPLSIFLPKTGAFRSLQVISEH